MSEKFNNMSFRTKLLLSYIAVIILCIIIFGLTVFSSISRRFENEITDNNAQITDLAVNNMTNTMNNIEQILYSVQANSTIEKMLTASNPPSPYEEIAAIEQELSIYRLRRDTVAFKGSIFESSCSMAAISS